MISFREYIKELNRKTSHSRMYEAMERVQPKTKDELVRILQRYFDIEEPDWKCDLNWIDTSKITDMSLLFSDETQAHGGCGLWKFRGDISKWDVSNVKDMHQMFDGSSFNGDISNWDVSKVKNMACMFEDAKFNKDISKWDVSNVEDMHNMFYLSIAFKQDVSNWDVSKVKNHKNAFMTDPELQPKFED